MSQKVRSGFRETFKETCTECIFLRKQLERNTGGSVAAVLTSSDWKKLLDAVVVVDVRRNRPMHTIIKIFGHSGGLNVKKKEPALGSASESVLEGVWCWWWGGGAARQPRVSRFFRTKK